jgi:hypothetical protein
MAIISYTAGEPAQGGGDPILPNGRYYFRVVDADVETSNAGNSMIEFKARNVKTDGTEGRAVYGRLVFTEKAMWRVDQFVAACGKHPGKGTQVEIDTDEMIGWEFEADVEITKDNKDRDRNEFTAFILPEEGGF